MHHPVCITGTLCDTPTHQATPEKVALAAAMAAVEEIAAITTAKKTDTCAKKIAKEGKDY